MGSDIHAYIINLESAVERWKYVEANFGHTGIPFSRISGVNGRELELPVAEYCETRYRLYHGKRTNMAEIGCYLSHVKSLQTFLASSHEYAIICEDDTLPKRDLKSVLQAAIDYCQTWDILRLCGGYCNARPVPYATLPHGYSLSVTFTRLSGAGAYMVNRRVAEILTRKLLPMRVPFDHALDREWFYGLRAASLTPLPIDQLDHAFTTQIADPAESKHYKLPWFRRYLTVFPYRTFNESARIINRLQQLRRCQRFVEQRLQPTKAA